MTDVHSVDDILVKSMQETPAPAPTEPVPEVGPVAQPVAELPSETKPETESVADVASVADAELTKPTKPTEPEVSKDSPIDEYGNPVAKPKMYTEEEVQNMIKRRLKNRYEEPQQPLQPLPAQKPAAESAQSAESGEDWEQQLGQFIDKRVEQREREAQERQWRQEQVARQQEFESKFTSGMGKYADFHEVVSGKPITDAMMRATFNLKDPAAFIYGASKLHPAEIDRIAKINDPYTQAVEVGRLHERMIKDRKVSSNASKPLETPNGDVPQKTYNKPSIEFLIDQHAKQKLANRR